MSELSEGTRRIIAVLERVPPGRVASYGLVARTAGFPNGARQVVRVLHSRSGKDGLPWHRILRADGSIALRPGAGFELQRALLAAEGVAVSPAGKVDLERFGWSPAAPTRSASPPSSRRRSSP